MDANGNLGRTMKVTKGSPTLVNFVKWVRTNDSSSSCGRGRLRGHLALPVRGHPAGDRHRWGPGRRSLLERDYRVGKDGTRVLSATRTYMIDEETGESTPTTPTTRTRPGQPHRHHRREHPHHDRGLAGDRQRGERRAHHREHLKGRGDTLTNTMDDFEWGGPARRAAREGPQQAGHHDPREVSDRTTPPIRPFRTIDRRPGPAGARRHGAGRGGTGSRFSQHRGTRSTTRGWTAHRDQRLLKVLLGLVLGVLLVGALFILGVANLLGLSAS